jgi:dTDP-4-dehydrorhamnose 3,5-epimerase
MAELAVNETVIPGFYEIDLVLHGDNRGWFKENYQKAKMEALGLPAFEVVQNNFSFNAEKGVTRGLHAEPWEKFISIASGKVFCAWVDLREGDSFGKVLTMELTPQKAVFVPRGVANSYQTLEPNITYTYLVNAHWSPDAKYAALNLFDPELNIPWPIPQGEAIVSEKDTGNPMLKDVTPMEFRDER